MSKTLTTLSDLDLFSKPPVQLSIEKTYETVHRPISILDSKSHIEFNISSGIDEYILLKDMQFYIKLKIDLNKTGSVTEADWKNISVVNNLMHSLFSSIDMQIDGKSITQNPQTYAYKAYFETSLGYSHDARSSVNSK